MRLAKRKNIAIYVLSSLIGILVCGGCYAQANVEVLIKCEGPFCPGSFGLIGADTPAKIAIIDIWHQKDAREQLIALFPKCNAAGQAYVLAALWHFDKKAFGRLAAEFVKDGGSIKTASGCIIDSETRAELVKLMQKTNSTMAFDNPPLSRAQRAELWRQEADKEFAAISHNPELDHAANNYEIEAEVVDEANIVVHLKPKTKQPIICSVDWGWIKKGKRWVVSPSVKEITEVLDDINQTPFICNINKQMPLDILLDAINGNFYPFDPDPDAKSKEDEEVTEAKALLKSIGRKDKEKLIKILARSKTGPLTLWHPLHTGFYMITWNIQINPDWREEYKRQTGYELSGTETDSGWIGTCDRQGKLTMVRSSLAKTIHEKVTGQLQKPHPPATVK